jgi:hypothetical protein
MDTINIVLRSFCYANVTPFTWGIERPPVRSSSTLGFRAFSRCRRKHIVIGIASSARTDHTHAEGTGEGP